MGYEFLISVLLSLLSFIGVTLIFFIKKLYVQIEDLTEKVNSLNVDIQVLKAKKSP